jgi:hypothetical protein
MERTESWYLMLCQKAGDRIDDPVPKWVHLAKLVSFSNVRKMCGEEDAEGSPDQVQAAYAAAGLGYQLRIVEFEDLELGDGNDNLTEVMLAFHERPSGADWFATMCSTAGLLTSASLKGPYDPKVAGLLAPVGAGHDVHAAMCGSCVHAVLTTPEGDERVVQGISEEDLALAWRYGYYLQACEMSLPDEARTALASSA